MSLFGVNIANIVANATKGQLNNAVITVYSHGERDQNNLTGGKQLNPVDINCEGIWTDFSSRDIDEQIVLTGDRKAMIIGNTLGGVLPKAGDRVVMDNETMHIVRLLDSDPARATYTFQCRGRIKPHGQ